jgi:hypothetical protein
LIAAEWDTWRDIAHSKAQIRRECDGASAPTAAETCIGINRHKTQSLEQDLEDDMKTIVWFFADGNDYDQTEDESLVWQRLAAKVGFGFLGAMVH